jgi:hypothetical protein
VLIKPHANREFATQSIGITALFAWRCDCLPHVARVYAQEPISLIKKWAAQIESSISARAFAVAVATGYARMPTAASRLHPENFHDIKCVRNSSAN